MISFVSEYTPETAFYIIRDLADKQSTVGKKSNHLSYQSTMRKPNGLVRVEYWLHSNVKRIYISYFSRMNI